MSKGMNRAERLTELKRLYIQQAFSDQELAERLGVERTTIYKDRIALEGEYPFVPEGYGRFRIDKTKLISEIKLDVNEALALYLAARRASRQTRTAQKPVASALEKLAAVLKQPMTERLLRSANTVLHQSADAARTDLLSQLTQAWVEQRKITLGYRGLQSSRTTYHPFCPYLIEPSIWSEGTYVIGHSDYFNDVVTLKVERIESIVMSNETFELPKDFDEQQLLKHAWGIWTERGGTPDVVQLRFTDAVAIRRLKESVWHPLEQVEEKEDGCYWSAPVGDWREMLPWVRGWGSACEVLGPVEMRAELIRGVQKMAKVYGVMEQKKLPNHWRLWAKADKKTHALHRLVYHMTDVGMTAEAVWTHALGVDLKARIAAWLKMAESEASTLIAFWASLHDLGKASPAFQDHQSVRGDLQKKIHAEIEKAGLTVKDRGDAQHARHEVVSTWSLDKEEWLVAISHLNSERAMLIAQMLGGHHGAWPSGIALSSTQLKTDDKGNDDWRIVRGKLVEDMVTIFQPPHLADFVPNTTEDNVMLALISGIVSVADWLGSDEENFAYEESFVELSEYAERSRGLAAQALARVQWESAPLAATFDFEAVFGFVARDAQIEIVDALKDVELPTLAIIEAPMGSGKTEAALATYAAWAKKIKQARLYVAMPTTATSNQMWGRVDEFLCKQHGMDAQPMLVHSQALLREEDPLPDASETLEEREKNGDHAAAQAWFLPRKRSLLVPFGVGTVDQALMSVLQTKHFFVRLLGLAGKVIIFDEVHAYDAYMNTLFARLLQWLRQVGASVIVLSATLPEKARKELISAWGVSDAPPAAQYPRLTWANSGEAKAYAIELKPPPTRTLAYGWIERDVSIIIQKLKDELRTGGCAAVICNTVTRAQQVYEAVCSDDDLKQITPDDRILFHARFPLAWREGIERRVLVKFGKNPNKKEQDKPNPARPAKAIVIATQVIEQSLDLDFDVMISDHAPADLLLQRAGRLHRHAVNNAARKQADVLWIAEPEVQAGIPAFARGDTYVYDEYVLLRSWLALRQRNPFVISLPQDVSGLIEQVYGERDLGTVSGAMAVRLAKAKQKMEGEVVKAEDKAEESLIREPEYKNLLFKQRNHELDEDNPDLNVAFRALTRLGDPGINVVCLERIHGQLFVVTNNKQFKYDPRSVPRKNTVIQLARSVVNVRHFDPLVQQALLHPQANSERSVIMTAWKKVSSLRYCALAIFENGKFILDESGYAFMLDKEFGLRVKKETQ